MTFAKITEKKVSSQQILYLFCLMPLLFMVTGLSIGLMDNVEFDIIKGYRDILLSPTILLTDFIHISGIGAAFFNVGIVGFFNIWLIHKHELKFNGVLIAAFMTVIGFSFFGKNLYNVLPIYFGGYLYTRYQKISFKDVIVVMMFGTALSPIISEISFAQILIPPFSILVGQGVGVFIGFVIVPLSSHMLKFHDGYNLYNIGFTSGIIGTVLTSILRSSGIVVSPVNLVHQENEPVIIGIITLIFVILIIAGLYVNPNALKDYKRIFKYKGRLITDFSYLLGYGITLLNVGILGLFSTAFVLLVGGVINGPVLAGIFTVAGFGAFGKHFRNIIPVMIGVIGMALVFGYELNSTGILIAILFSTTLAPIAGTYGPIMGIIAGMVHMILVTNVGVIHGGINLYNNGFSGGLVAGVLIPVVDAFRKE